MVQGYAVRANASMNEKYRIDLRFELIATNCQARCSALKAVWPHGSGVESSDLTSRSAIHDPMATANGHSAEVTTPLAIRLAFTVSPSRADNDVQQWLLIRAGSCVVNLQEARGGLRMFTRPGRELARLQ
jgi:hypothetical protein